MTFYINEDEQYRIKYRDSNKLGSHLSGPWLGAQAGDHTEALSDRSVVFKIDFRLLSSVPCQPAHHTHAHTHTFYHSYLPMEKSLSDYDQSLEELERQREELELVMKKMGQEWEERYDYDIHV